MPTGAVRREGDAGPSYAVDGVCAHGTALAVLRCVVRGRAAGTYVGHLNPC